MIADVTLKEYEIVMLIYVLKNVLETDPKAKTDPKTEESEENIALYTI